MKINWINVTVSKELADKITITAARLCDGNPHCVKPDSM